MRVRIASNRQLLTLDIARRVGSGGEGDVYPIIGTPESLAKVYRASMPLYARKLEVMIAHPPKDPMAARGHVSIAWPTDILVAHDVNERFVGFSMPRVTDMRTVFEFYHTGVRRAQCPLFNYRYLLRAARNLAAAFRALHAKGYVVGDVNECNTLVADSALVTLIDTDSFQVRDPRTAIVYRCPVGREEFTPPELHGKDYKDIDRTPESDLFGLGVLLFQLLIGGHPFNGVPQSPNDESELKHRIQKGHFPYGNRRVPYSPSPVLFPFSTLAPELQHLFIECFEMGHRDPIRRPNAQEWQNALDEVESSLLQCSRNTQHLYAKHLAKCPWCDWSKQFGIDPFPSRRAVQTGQHIRAARHQLPLPRIVQPAIVPRAPTLQTVSPPAARRTAVKPSFVIGLGCLGVTAAWLVFVVISLVVQSFSNSSSNQPLDPTQIEQLKAIKAPPPGESVEFDITVYPSKWSPPITIPTDYHLAAEIMRNDGVKVWRSTNGNTGNQGVMTPGAVWNVWSESFVKIYNPLAKRMPYMAGPWASSVQFESAERFPIPMRIRLEPARQDGTLNQKQRSASASTPLAQPPPSTRRHQGIFGIITSVDYNRQTFTVISIGGTNVFNVTNRTRLLRAGKPVTLREIVENEKASGAAVKNDDGSLDASILELGETEKAPSGANSGDIQKFGLQAVAYRDALQTMRQEWPHETFGYFDTRMSYGDITGDHRDEAAVWVHYRLSGEASTPSFSNVFVYTLMGGRVALIATLKGGDRAYGGIESVKIQDGRLVLGRYKPETPSACMACYGFIETTEYRWDGINLAATAVRISKLEKKSQNTSVGPDNGLLSKSASLAQVSPTVTPSAPPPVRPLTFPGERFPDTRNRILTASELQRWSTDQLQYAINEIFARHGGDFPDKKVHANFERFAWYHSQRGVSFDQIEASLPEIERENVKILGAVRDAKRDPLNTVAGPWFGILYWKDGTINKQELVFSSDLNQVQNRASNSDGTSGWESCPVQKKGNVLSWQIPRPGRMLHLSFTSEANGQQAQVSCQILEQGRVAYSAAGRFFRNDVPLPHR